LLVQRWRIGALISLGCSLSQGGTFAESPERSREVLAIRLRYRLVRRVRERCNADTWWQREKRIVDPNREILGIDVVRCVGCAQDCQIQCRQRERSGDSSYCVLSFHIRFLFEKTLHAFNDEAKQSHFRRRHQSHNFFIARILGINRDANGGRSCSTSTRISPAGHTLPEKPAVSGHCLETAATNDQDAFF
jgi:hypothetical protein